MNEWWRVDGWPTPDEWQAFWSFLSAAFAASLLIIAWRQLHGLSVSNTRLSESNNLLAESNRALARPTVIVQFEFERVPVRNYSNQENINSVFIVVQNVGTSPAMNISLNVDPKFEATDVKLSPEGLLALNTLFSGKTPVRMVGPHQRLKYILDSAKDALAKEDLPTEYVVTATYSNLDESEQYSDSFVLQMSPWAMTVAEVDPVRQLSKDVQFISENLRKSHGGFRSIVSAIRDQKPNDTPRLSGSRRIRARRPRGF
ncbi:hypothetical protein [Pseudoclavibacter sp. RFBG4]|uniref:hypothetical protein n=1 Tax=Pseudoclavibacter sp. RFBG4 TaxID=2080575 RepID=UPI0011B05423|nr:hypothetical protein [Pseudoclavibacter sp. RFBG4]